MNKSRLILASLTQRLWLSKKPYFPSSFISITLFHVRYFYSTIPVTSEPSLLLRIRSDLKIAMRERDKNRLNAVRGALAEITNFSKMNKSVLTDAQIVAMLRTRAKLSKSASEEFRAAKRDDLREKEEAQIAVLQEYIESVKMISEEEIFNLAVEAVNRLEFEGRGIYMGSVIKSLLEALDGKAVEMANVSRIVREVVRVHSERLE